MSLGQIQKIRLLALMEATTVTGPAKNLMGFCRRALSPEFNVNGLPRVETTILTFCRGAEGNDETTHASEKGQSPTPFVAAARDAGIEVEVIEERFRFDPRVIEQLRAIVARRKPDIIQTHMVKSHFLVKLSGLGGQYPWIAYHHGYTTPDLKMRLYNRFNRWSLPSATRVITVCESFASQLAEAGVARERIFVRHNSVTAPPPVSEEEVAALRSKFGIKDSEKLILTVGRLSLEKGHADFIAALAELRVLNPALDFKALLVGDGPERERLEQRAREHQLKDRVLFAGQVANPRVFYAMADALVLPSHSEGSPNVLLEAMAAGVPVVATAVGGVPEIAIADESALLVPARDARALASALERILTDEHLAETLARSASLRVAEHFSPESYARSLVEFYGGLMTSLAHAAGPEAD